jgi:hypothetical protein
MSQAEIQYFIPSAARPQGDTEAILNAIGSYQNEIRFHVVQEAMVAETETGDVMVRFVKSTHDMQPRSLLLEDTERMRKGVEHHFDEDDRSRLASHFAGVAIRGAHETE